MSASKITRQMVLKITFLFACLLFLSCGRDSTIPDRSATDSVAEHTININTASTAELQRIPHIGEKLAAKIIEHREVNGPFRRAEHLMLIQGISDKRFRKIRPLVRVE